MKTTYELNRSPVQQTEAETLKESPSLWNGVATATPLKCPFAHLIQKGDISAQTAVQELSVVQSTHQTASKTTRPAYTLYTPWDIQHPETSGIATADYDTLMPILRWTQSFISQPHSELGRSGAVCPYVKPAMREGVMYLTACRLTEESWEADLWQAVFHFRDILLEMQPLSVEGTKLKTIMMVFPDLGDKATPSLMEPLHQRLKSALLENGLLIGQFYPDCPVPGTWNAGFLPLQSPLPMFVIRHLIESDMRFLQGNPLWETAYKSQFSSKLSL